MTKTKILDFHEPMAHEPYQHDLSIFMISRSWSFGFHDPMIMILVFPWSYDHNSGKFMIPWSWSSDSHDLMIMILRFPWSHDHDPENPMISWSWSWKSHDPMIMILKIPCSHDHDPDLHEKLTVIIYFIRIIENWFY